MSIPYLHQGQTRLLLQVKKDLDTDEGYREYAYPDPLTSLYKKYARKGEWGYRPAIEIVDEGEDLEKGEPWTYGYGFTYSVTHESRIGKIQAERQLEELILAVDEQLSDTLTWYATTSFVNKTVLINMAFNLGLKGLLKFRNTLAYFKAGNYKAAAAGMRHSLWYKQVGNRAEYLAKRVESQSIAPQHKAPETIQ